MQEIRLNIDAYNVKRWFKKGTNILHREDGPAVEDIIGNKFWYQNGLLHREDGPAIEYWDGYKYWYVKGKQYSEIEFHLNKNNFTYNDKNKELILNNKKYKLILIDD